MDLVLGALVAFEEVKGLLLALIGLDATSSLSPQTWTNCCFVSRPRRPGTRKGR